MSICKAFLLGKRAHDRHAITSLSSEGGAPRPQHMAGESSQEQARQTLPSGTQNTHLLGLLAGPPELPGRGSSPDLAWDSQCWGTDPGLAEAA